jgi:Tol biopolymer transport system component
VAATRGGKSFVFVQGVAGPSFDAVTDPAFSPDGREVVYGAVERGRAFLVRGDKRGEPFDAVDSPVFASQGAQVAFFAASGGKCVVVVGTRVITPPGAAFDGFSGYPVFSPDGTKVVFSAMVGKQSCAVVDNARGPLFDSVSTPVWSRDSKRVAYLAGRGPKLFVIVADAVTNTEIARSAEFDWWLFANPMITFNADGTKVAHGAVLGKQLWWKVLAVTAPAR